jgi:hypothetical protein
VPILQLLPTGMTAAAAAADDDEEVGSSTELSHFVTDVR